MQTIGLTAYNNQDYQLTLDFSAWISAGYDLSTRSRITKQASLVAGDARAVLRWSNVANEADGLITLNGSRLVFTMPAKIVAARVPNAGALAYDARIVTSAGRVVDMFGGSLTFNQGVTPVG